MLGSRSLFVWFALACLLMLAASAFAYTEEPAELSAPLRHSLARFEMHGLLGGDAALADMIAVGRTLFYREDYDAAAVIFETAVRHFPGSAIARFALGQALFARGDYARGAQAVREGLQMDPYWAKIDYSVYGLYDYPGDVDRQVRILKDYLRDRADDRDALFLLGFFQYHLTRNDEARASFLRLAGMEPGDDMAGYYARLLNEKEKIRLGISPYLPEGKKAVHHRHAKRSKAGKASHKPASKTKAAAPADSAPAAATAEAPSSAATPPPPAGAPPPGQ